MSFVDLLRNAVEPKPELVDVDDRRRARILTVLLFAALPLGFATILAQVILVPSFLPTFIANSVTLMLLGVVVLIARGRFYRQAALAAMIIIVAACLSVGVANPDDPVWWSYTTIAVLLATVLVSTRAAAWIAATAVVGTAAVGLWHGQGLAHLVPPVSFQIVFFPLLLVLAHYRNRLEHDRRNELTVQARLIEDAQATAGLGHWELKRGEDEAYVSPALASILELEPDKVPFQTLLSRIAPADQERAKILIAGAGATPRRAEIAFSREGRSDGLASISVVMHDDDEGRIIGTVHDLTGRIKQETEKARLLSQVHESKRLETIGRVAGGVAHDFNNLLTIFVTSASLLRESPNEELRDEVLEEVDLAAQRGASLVRNLLAYARRQVLEPDELNVNIVVEELAPILRRLVQGQLEVDIASSGAIVVADRSQLEQVILNLVVNASEASGPRGHITLRLFGETPKKGPLALTECSVIEVRDDGPGMSGDVSAHIFEPFFTTKDEDGGTGLGLSTVHGIVHQSGGELVVESTPGEGTLFRVRLPVVEDSSPRPLAPRALVVDDEELVRVTTARILQQAGLDVVTAASADEAIDLWTDSRGAFDLVVTDLVMPGTDGAELLTKLLELKPELPAVLVTGYAGDRLKGREVLLEKVDLVHKPFAPRDLLEVVSAKIPSVPKPPPKSAPKPA